MKINWDSNYFNFIEETSRNIDHSNSNYSNSRNDSINFSFEKIDEPDTNFDTNIEDNKKYFVLLDEQKNTNILTEEEWEGIIKIKTNKSNFNTMNNHKDKIIISIKSGIPSNLRGEIWKFLSKSDSISLNHDRSFFSQLLKVKSPQIESQIKKDLTRTSIQTNDTSTSNDLNDSTNTLTTEKLFDILKAYAIYDPLVGYSQGMNFIVAMILVNIASPKDAFWHLVQIMYHKNWRHLYINNTKKLMNILDVLTSQIKLRINDLYEHFENEDVSGSSILLNLIHLICDKFNM